MLSLFWFALFVEVGCWETPWEKSIEYLFHWRTGQTLFERLLLKCWKHGLQWFILGNSNLGHLEVFCNLCFGRTVTFNFIQSPKEKIYPDQTIKKIKEKTFFPVNSEQTSVCEESTNSCLIQKVYIRTAGISFPRHVLAFLSWSSQHAIQVKDNMYTDINFVSNWLEEQKVDLMGSFRILIPKNLEPYLASKWILSGNETCTL